MKRLMVLLCVVFAVSGCKKEEKGESAEAPAEKPVEPAEKAAPEEKPAEPAPAAAGEAVLVIQPFSLKSEKDDVALTVTAEGKVMAGDKAVGTVTADGHFTVNGKVVASIDKDGVVSFEGETETGTIDEAGSIVTDSGVTVTTFAEDGTVSFAEGGGKATYEGPPEARRTASFVWYSAVVL